MKKIRKLLIVFVLGIAIVYGVYHFGSNYVFNKVVEEGEKQLVNSGQIEKLKEQVNNNPELKSYIEEGASIDESTVPFNTKEEAMKKLISKFNFSELKDIQSKIQDGVTTEEQTQLLEEVESKLTKEELDALKVVLYKEFSQ